ncbi:VIN3-like protein 2 [Senna tora]|uniref:VIN3-like protein 2 n=1 Tax=Senna tora TaxID=362788 RepID=A0A835CEU4_9FABA|nr:VIN3-like protein 2 [Senna tora]
MEEKRELVYEISKLSHGASEMLQSWSRQEILQILCAEMGKERKYTGLTKLKIIENLLKIVSEKKSGGHEIASDLEPHSSASHGQKPAKRQRKNENPSRLPLPVNDVSVNNGVGDVGSITYCKNTACKATLSEADAFCKRCSCCICHKYDDNKDPSLWLICGSEPPFLGVSCGLSCHLECALKHESSGIAVDGKCPKLDGGFYCISCGKMNDLLGCWRKQLTVAKDTRRVDILCYRVSLSQRILQGTEKYQKLHEIVDEAVRKLELEVGPVTGSPVKIGRGIVNRLSSGPEVQKLCGLALESLDSILSKRVQPTLPNSTIQDTNLIAPNMVRFEDVTDTSLTVILGSEDPSGENILGYALWHRKAHDVDYPVEPACTLRLPIRSSSIRGLIPATEYCFKVVPFNDSRELGMCEVHVTTDHGEEEVPNCSATERSQSPVTNCSSHSNPSSVEDETNNSNPYSDQTDNRADNYLTYHKDTDKLASENLSNDAIKCSNTGGGGLPANADSLLEKQRAKGLAVTIPGSEVLKLENNHSPEEQITEDLSTDDGLNSPVQIARECLPLVRSSEAGLPITPCKLEILKEGPGRNGRLKSIGKDQENGSGKREGPQDGSTSKRGAERQGEGCAGNGFSDRDFEYYVKVIRWLECEGHIEKNFRQKFLTWYSLRATPQEVKIVKVYIDTFLEDPASLAEQLVDTFSECVSNKRPSVVPAGFCMKLWH